MSVCLSVRPSVRTEQIDSHWKDFSEMLKIWAFFFRNSAEKNQFLLKCDRNNV
jgi:hypothetical protein